MKSVEQVVFDLLQSNECVVVPAFGGFIAKQRSARVDYNEGIAYPPTKEVAFNIQLKENDGLLINTYGVVNKLDYIQSTHSIEESVIGWNQTIGSGSKLILPKLGTFWKDKEGNVQFEQDRSFNLLLSAYGLESVRFIPVESQINEPVLNPIEKQDKSAFWKYAAAAAVAIPIAFYSVWIPVNTPVIESGMFSLHDFNPFKATKKGSYVTKPLHITPIKAVKHETAYLSAYDSYFNPIVPEHETNLTQINPQSMYCIAGCFSNEDNAMRLQSKLNGLGFETSILVEGGLFKVSMGSGFSEEAIAQIEIKAKQLNISYWILN